MSIHRRPPGKEFLPPSSLQTDLIYSGSAPGRTFAPAWTQIEWRFVYIQAEWIFPNRSGYRAVWKLQLWLQGVLAYSEPPQQRNMNFILPHLSDSPMMSQRNSGREVGVQALLLGLFSGKKMLTPHDASSKSTFPAWELASDHAQKLIVCFS